MAKRTPILTAKLTASWQDFENLVNPVKFQRRYRAAVKKATKLNASIVLHEVRVNIETGKYARGRRRPNAGLTEMIKGYDHPLVDSGRMGNLFGMEVIDYRTAEVGISSQSDAKWIAAVHDGVSLRITKSMRNMFRMLTAASDGKNVTLTGRAAELFARFQGPWLPLGENKRVIRIPRRPFFKEVVESARVQRVCRENWQIATSRAVAGLPTNLAHLKKKV